ncbi:hypothetical protein [Nocardia otitidiscaviarum]|uniref:hypothetical protein n=1 Tax=Nocardia otitidiscaviarum TaxID=1823 RepID=UPI0018953E1C|nr:hypothetical protein [Nocardia otitidiscaviarum]MBF6181709.1 hypothetical protein [Nocardia otitidiscaviarum]
MSEIQNPTDLWPVLRERAQTGQLEFEPDVAYEAAELASEVIGELLALRLVAEQVETDLPLSNLSSGSALGSRFAMKGSDLHRLLGRHIDILEDMVDTFIAAGRSYAAAEGENADIFDNLSAPQHPAELSSRPPETTPIVGAHDGRYVMPEAGTAHGIMPPTERLGAHDSFDTPVFEVESAAGKTYRYLYELGNSIAVSSSAQRTADWSGIWAWMAGQLRETYTDFVNRMGSVTAENWRGAGGDAATASVHTYAENMSALWDSMYLVGDNLAYTSGWLEATRVSMPQQPSNPAGDIGDIDSGGDILAGQVATDPTPQYRRNMRDTYIIGLPWSMERLPVLPEPQVSLPGIDPPAQSGGSGGTGAGGAGGAAPAAAGVGAAMPGAASTGQPVVPMSTPTPRYPDAGGLRPGVQGQSATTPRGATEAATAPRGADTSGQLADSALRSAQQALTAGQGALSGIPGPGRVDPSAVSARPTDAAVKGPSGSSTGGRAGGGGGVSPVRDPAQSARLFPRATPPVDIPAASTRAATPMAGIPGTPGAAGAHGGAANKDGSAHKRPVHLEGAHHLEEGLGAPLIVSRPVLDE